MAMRFSIEIGRQEVACFPIFIWKHQGSYLMRLIGMNVDPHKFKVFPMYQQLFDLVRHPGQVVLSLFAFRRDFELILQKRDPFISFSIQKTELFQESGDED